MKRLIGIEESSDHLRSSSCSLTELATKIMDETIRDLQDYCGKDDKTGNKLTKRGDYEYISH